MSNTQIPKCIEDIYPLTIIITRFGGKVVIFNRDSDSGFIHEVQLGERSVSDLSEMLNEELSPSPYGIGEDIYKAFDDYQQRCIRESKRQ